MANSVAYQATTAVQNLQTMLRSYAAGRLPNRFVGQFLDDEGRKGCQYGVYGMGAWVALMEDQGNEIRNDPAVRTLSTDCKQELRRLINAASKESTETRARDIRSVIPKACYAYLGLSRSIDCQSEINLLLSWIGAAQQHDGSWGYLATSSQGCPEVTALVVRNFSSARTLADQIRDAITYLRGALAGISNPYVKLYVLNTIAIHSNGSALSEDLRKIKATVATLLNQAFFNPTQFPNPINFDFNDADRTRYIRLSTDVILLESLTVLSGTHKLYVRGHPGLRVFGHMLETLSSPPTTDSSGHRMTPPSAYHLYRCLAPLTKTKQSSGLIGVFERLWAFAVCSWAFGVNIGWNFLALTICLIGLILATTMGGQLLIGGLAGALMKTTLDTVKSVYNSLRQFGGNE